MSKPELFVEPDPELPLAILDQKEVISLYLNVTIHTYKTECNCILCYISLILIIWVL